MPTCQPTCGLGWLLDSVDGDAAVTVGVAGQRDEQDLLGQAIELAGNAEADAHVAALTALIG
jgi:hypothetical protein